MKIIFRILAAFGLFNVVAGITYFVIPELHDRFVKWLQGKTIKILKK